MLPYARHLKPLARELRKNQTDAEAALWKNLRRKQIHDAQFYRQKPLGPFVVDFFCPAARLVVEVDGGQHFTEEGAVSDAERDVYLAGMELTVLRFSNHDVLASLNDVLDEISRHVASSR